MPIGVTCLLAEIADRDLSLTQEAMRIHCPQQTVKVDAVVGIVSEVGCDQVQRALEDGLEDGWHLVDHKELHRLNG